MTGTTAIQIPVVKRAVVDFAVGADWTPAAGDVKVNIDGAGAANVTNLPTAVAMGNTAYWEFVLTAAELSGKSIKVSIADSATKAVEDQFFIVETYGNASAMYQWDMSLANLPANMAQILGTAVSTPATAGILDVNIKNIVNVAAALDAANLLKVDCEDWKGGVIPAVNVTGVPKVDIVDLLGTAWLTPGVAGTPDVNAKLIGGTAQTGADLGTKAGYALSNAGIDALFVRQLTEAYNADGVAPTVAQALFLLISALTEFAISGTTITTKKLDGTTQATQYTLDSSTTPTSRTRSA